VVSPPLPLSVGTKLSTVTLPVVLLVAAMVKALADLHASA
jgi:hypothetical protein